MKKIAIIEDDKLAADTLCIQIENANMAPFLVEGTLPSLDGTVELIQQNSDAAVCDHRLTVHQYATFTGACLVAQLYKQEFPAILVTQHLNGDCDTSIRKYRDKIPVLLPRNQADDSHIVHGIEVCEREFSSEYAPERRPWRTLVRLEHVEQQSGENLAEAVIPGWNPRIPIQFPTSLLPNEINELLQGQLRQEDKFYLIANVNIGAQYARDIYLTEFAVAEKPDPEISSHFSVIRK